MLGGSPGPRFLNSKLPPTPSARLITPGRRPAAGNGKSVAPGQSPSCRAFQALADCPGVSHVRLRHWGLLARAGHWRHRRRPPAGGAAGRQAGGQPGQRGRTNGPGMTAHPAMYCRSRHGAAAGGAPGVPSPPRYHGRRRPPSKPRLTDATGHARFVIAVLRRPAALSRACARTRAWGTRATASATTAAPPRAALPLPPTAWPPCTATWAQTAATAGPGCTTTPTPPTAGAPLPSSRPSRWERLEPAGIGVACLLGQPEHHRMRAARPHSEQPPTLLPCTAPLLRPAAAQLEVYRRRSGHPSAYWMAFTSGEQDIDVSRAMHEGGLFEPGYTWAWSVGGTAAWLGRCHGLCMLVQREPCACRPLGSEHCGGTPRGAPACTTALPLPALPCRHYLLRDGCRGPGGERRLVVDVGANFGAPPLLQYLPLPWPCLRCSALPPPPRPGPSPASRQPSCPTQSPA